METLTSALRPEGLSDLEALVQSCRDGRTRAYIAEAVASYRAGAYRASIVTTWVAIVFDFIHKLQELELAGDAQARSVLDEFRRYQATADVKSSWEFERKVLERAVKDFELLTRHEFEDLERVLADRNRCAHPAMTTNDDAYAPSAELARLHLRNAVFHLLQHPPVQGQAALDRLRREVMSEYFPTKLAEAVVQFKQGPLARPRDALVRNFTLANLKHLLGPDLETAAAPRFVAALAATREMHRGVFEATMREKATPVFRGAIEGGRWRSALRLLKLLPDVWPFLHEDVHGLLTRYVDALVTGVLAVELPMALDCAELRATATARLERATEAELASIAVRLPRKELVPRAVELYAASDSFEDANRRANELILPLIPALDSESVRKILDAAGANSEITQSFRWKKVREGLRQSGALPAADFEEVLKANRLVDE